MAHKIIALIVTLTLFTKVVPMDEFIIAEKEPIDEQKSESPLFSEKTKSTLITAGLFDCEQIIKRINIKMDIIDKTFNVDDSNLENCNQKIKRLEKEMKITQKNIVCLENSNKNSDQHLDILEESINHMTNSIQILNKHMQNLNSNITKNYATKEEVTFYQKKLNNSLDHPTTSYRQYLLKITPAVAIVLCIGVIYFARKTIQKRLLATPKK